jgi:hypothetical protein
MKLRALAMTAAALAAGTALAVLGPASPAVGFFSPPLLLDVQIQPTATHIAKGAAVETRLEVTCAGATEAFVNVSLVQRAGSEIASGYGYTQVGCTSQRQTVIVLVTADPGKAFKKGTAVADASISACTPDYSVCGYESDESTISITQ